MSLLLTQPASTERQEKTRSVTSHHANLAKREDTTSILVPAGLMKN
jgi:hypothetical protein